VTSVGEGIPGKLALLTEGRSVEEEDSPYPEVRSAVANADDFNMVAWSLRTWVLGTARSKINKAVC
jgi:hypothetical protein